MKKLFVIIAALSVIAAVIGCAIGVAAPRTLAENGKLLKGSGDLVTRNFEVSGFTAVRADGCAEVLLVEGSGPVTVEADDNVMEFVAVRVEGNTLRIGLHTPDVRRISDITLRATVPAGRNLSALRAKGASRIDVRPVVTAERLSVEASGAASIRASVRTDACDITATGASDIKIACDGGLMKTDASGAAKIELSGTASQLTAETSGAAKLRAEGLDAEICRAEASEASKISLRCTRKLTADASGAAKITYTGGSTDNTVSKSGAGSVKRR